MDGVIKVSGKELKWDGNMTVDKLEELSRWALEHRIEPNRCKCGWEYFWVGTMEGLKAAKCQSCGEWLLPEELRL